MRLHQHLRREHGRHTDDWLITYADTITLLLCLFVVILATRTGEKSSPRDLPPPVDHRPAATGIFTSGSPVPSFVRIVDPPVGDTPAVSVETVAQPETAALPATAAAAQTPARVADDAITPFVGPFVAPLVVPPGVDIAAAPAAPPAPAVAVPATRPEIVTIAPPAEASHRKFNGTDVVEQRGDRITTMRINSAAFFGSGFATISPAGNAILRDVAVELKSNEYAAYHISIEGHTDDTPISTGQFQSNWELSTARAAAVVRFLLEQGISPRKLSAAGYAETYPIAPNRNADGTVIPENQAANRRVVIKLEKIDKAER